jgi:hypothetical protein
VPRQKRSLRLRGLSQPLVLLLEDSLGLDEAFAAFELRLLEAARPGIFSGDQRGPGAPLCRASCMRVPF